MSKNWHQFFLEMTDVIKEKSKDLATKVGCVIVGPNNEVRSIGFNGFPRGVKDDIEENKDRYERPQKYMWTEHSERNAIANAARIGVPLEGCTIYQGWIPCCDCARMIIQSGIKRVIIDGRNFEETDKYWNERWKESMEVSKAMLREAGVELLVYGHDNDKLETYELAKGVF